MRTKLRSATSTLSLSLSNVSRTLSILLVTIFLGRASGPAIVGEFSVLLATVAILQSVSIGGLSGAAVHKLLTVRENSYQAIQVIISARLILIPTIYALGFGVAAFAMRNDGESLLPLAVFFVGYALCTFDVPELLWTSRSGFSTIAYRRICMVATISVPKIFAAAAGSYSWVLILQGIEAALWQVTLLYKSGLSGKIVIESSRRVRAGLQQLNELRNLWLSAIASAAAMRADIFIVTAILGSSAAGQYATASRFVEAASILAVAMTTVMFNPLVKSSEVLESYYRRCVVSSRVVLAVALAIVAGLVILGPYLISFLYGSEFELAAEIIAVYAFTVIPIFQRQLLSKFLIIERAYGYSLTSNLANLVANAILNVILIQCFGVWGAVFAALGSYVLSTYIIFFFNQKGRDILTLSIGSVALGKSMMVPALTRSVQSRKV